MISSAETRLGRHGAMEIKKHASSTGGSTSNTLSLTGKFKPYSNLHSHLTSASPISPSMTYRKKRIRR